MFKKLMIYIFMTALLSIFLIPVPCRAAEAEPKPESHNSKGISPVSGTFIQPWLYNNFTDEYWEKELTNWKHMGIEYVIMGDTAMVHYADNYKIVADYDSQIEGAVTNSDVVTKLFEKCSEYGIKVYLGMGNSVGENNGGHWNYFDFSKDENAGIFKEVCTRFAMIAEDMYNLYSKKYKDTFAGFYFVPELYNSSAFDNESLRQKYVDGMAAGFNVILDKLNSFETDYPLIFSPYVNIFGGSWVSKDFNNIEAFWTEFIKKANFREGDILCPQDSVGAGGMDLDNLDAMTKAYKNAVTNSEKGVLLYSNCEIFVQPHEDFTQETEANKTYGVNYWTTCTVDRMVEQFKIVSKYVDRIFTFSHPHYLSSLNSAPGFYNLYIHYLETGELDSTPPTPPDKLRTYILNLDGEQVLHFTWSGMYDDFGVYRVNIYKNGELMNYRLTSRTNGTLPSDSSVKYPYSAFDPDYDFNTAEPVTYEFEVIDVGGNISERSSFTVLPGSVPNNEILGEIYNGPTDESADPVPGDNSSEDAPSASSSDSKIESTADKDPDKNGWLLPVIIGAAVIAVTALAGFLIFRKKKK